MQHRADLICKPQVEAAAFRWRDMFLRGAEPPPSARIVGLHYHPWLIVFVVCIGAFIGQLDASIVQLTLPALAKLWNVPLTEVRWVSIGYLLAAVGFMPVFGRICELFGRKLVYLVGFSLFGVSSLLCGLASDVTMAWSMTHLAGADRPHLFSGQPVIASVESALTILLLFAMICGALSLVRGPAAGTTGEIISDLRR